LISTRRLCPRLHLGTAECSPEPQLYFRGLLLTRGNRKGRGKEGKGKGGEKRREEIKGL